MRDLSEVLAAMETFHKGMIIGTYPKELAITGICAGLLHFALSIHDGRLSESDLILAMDSDMLDYWDRKEYYFAVLEGIAAMKHAN